MSELFEIPVCESPRLKWLKKYNIHTHRNATVKVGDTCEVTGEKLSPWCATVGAVSANGVWADGWIGFGDTEDDAIANLARKRGWRMWNEE